MHQLGDKCSFVSIFPQSLLFLQFQDFFCKIIWSLNQWKPICIVLFLQLQIGFSMVDICLDCGWKWLKMVENICIITTCQRFSVDLVFRWNRCIISKWTSLTPKFMVYLQLHYMHSKAKSAASLLRRYLATFRNPFWKVKPSELSGPDPFFTLCHSPKNRIL